MSATKQEVVQHTGFSTMNPYEGMIALTANSPDELTAMINEIKTPLKIMGFTSYGSRQVCYVLASGFKIKKVKKVKE